MSDQKNLMIYAIVALVVGSALGYGGGYMTIQPQLDTANGKVTTLTTQVNTLTTDVAAKATQITGLQSDVATKTTQISTLTGQLNTATATIADQETSIQAKDDAINNYETVTVPGLEAQVTAKTTALAQKTAELDTATATISQQETDLADKDSQIQTLSDDKASLETQVTDLTAKTVPKPGYTRIQFFGLTFEVPEVYTLKLSSSTTGYASETTGYVTARSTTRSFTVWWSAAAESPNLDMQIDAEIAALAAYSPVAGAKHSTTVNGHEARYETFTINVNGVTEYGIDVWWYCEQTHTVYEYMSIVLTDTAYADFVTSSGYFTCH